ncbi:MAG: phosphoribosylanthranilate isomerase [Ignavibacteriales bacterium]
MKVKICGIKRIEDALKAVEFGADAIGLLIKTSSKNSIDPTVAKKIVQKLPPFCSSVMVVTITDIKEIVDLAKYIGVTSIQLHGHNSPEDIVQIKKEIQNIKIIKTIHVMDAESIDNCKDFYNNADTILLDSSNKANGAVGGTGLTHDWNISKRIVSECPLPVILAGGLKPENIVEAIKIVKPYGVDVQSGVNGQDGFKDYSKMKQFIEKAKNK